MKTLIIIACLLVVLAIIMVYSIKHDSVELTPDSPFFNDEIEAEGIDKVKIKK
jgi:hypothetical protein